MNTMKKIAVAVALAMATPAVAQTILKPRPMHEKYSDTGAQPATGRAGSAGIEARALRDINGKTDIEVTTGRFEGIGGGGVLGKVQVKLFDGAVHVGTDNYKLTSAGLGTGTFSYDALYLGQGVQVQANVSGIDPNRTDVVTATTQVRQRPDLDAVSLTAQPRVLVNAPVTIRGVVSETNGDLGARATCRLFADGIEIAAIPGAWIDAASSVTCAFRTSFASLGPRNLKLRVTDVEPADYDASNNEASLAIDVVETNVDEFRVSVFEERAYTDLEIFDFLGTNPVSTRAWRQISDQRYQYVDVWNIRMVDVPVTGRVTFRHSSGGVPLPSVSVPVQDMLEFWVGCRGAVLSSGQGVEFCSGNGQTRVSVWTYVGAATYVVQQSSNGLWGDSSSYHAYSEELGTFLTLGADYTAELLHETEQGIYGGAVSAPLVTEAGSLNQYMCRRVQIDWEQCVKQDSHWTFVSGTASASGN